MKTKSCAGFTITELAIAVLLMGMVVVGLLHMFSTSINNRSVLEVGRELREWHGSYAEGLSRAEFNRSSGSGAVVTQNITTPGGISVTLTDTYSAPVATIPGLVMVTSVATWNFGTGLNGSSSVRVFKVSQFTTN